MESDDKQVYWLWGKRIQLVRQSDALDAASTTAPGCSRCKGERMITKAIAVVMSAAEVTLPIAWAVAVVVAIEWSRQ